MIIISRTEELPEIFLPPSIQSKSNIIEIRHFNFGFVLNLTHLHKHSITHSHPSIYEHMPRPIPCMFPSYTLTDELMRKMPVSRTHSSRGHQRCVSEKISKR